MKKIKETIDKYSEINIKKFISTYIKEKYSLFGLISFFVSTIIYIIIMKNISVEHGSALISFPFVCLAFGGLFFGTRLLLSRLINPLIIGSLNLLIYLIRIIQYFFAGISEFIEINMDKQP